MKEENLNHSHDVEPNVKFNQDEQSQSVINDSENKQEVIKTQENINECLMQQLSKVVEASEKISSQLDKNIHEDVLIRNMHSELQEYKANMYRKIMLPLINQVIQLSDNVRSIIRFYPVALDKESVADNYVKLRDEYNKIPEQIADMLACFFVESFESEPGRSFDPKKQSVGGILSGNEQEDDNVVTKSLSPGYLLKDEKEEFLLRREKVEIYKYDNNK